MKWSIQQVQRSGYNIISVDDERWIATVYGEEQSKELRMIQRAPEMLEILKGIADPEARRLVEYIESGK